MVNDVPKNLKLGITAGIGLFIAIVGLKGAGIIVKKVALRDRVRAGYTWDRIAEKTAAAIDRIRSEALR